MQIEEETRNMAHFTDFRVVSVVGGQSLEEQGFALRWVSHPASFPLCVVAPAGCRCAPLQRALAPALAKPELT